MTSLPTDFPDHLARSLTDCLAWLSSYRANIARGRALDTRFGGEGRYLDDIRRGDRRGLMVCVREVREFVKVGREIGEDPIGILRVLEGARVGVGQGGGK